MGNKNKQLYSFIFLFSILAISAVVIPMQTVNAQRGPIIGEAGDFVTKFVRLVGQSSGLIAITVNNDVVTDVIHSDRNNVPIPISIPVTPGRPVIICTISVNNAGEPTGGPQSCRTIINIAQHNQIVLPVRQTVNAQGGAIIGEAGGSSFSSSTGTGTTAGGTGTTGPPSRSSSSTFADLSNPGEFSQFQDSIPRQPGQPVHPDLPRTPTLPPEPREPLAPPIPPPPSS